MISKNKIKVELEPVDQKLEQLHSLMNVIQNTLEIDDSGLFDKDVANLMGVGKTICASAHERLNKLTD